MYFYFKGTALECDKPHFRVRTTKTPCDNNTCETALSAPHPCTKLAQLITWCDCEEYYYRDSNDNCVTIEQCKDQQEGKQIIYY